LKKLGRNDPCHCGSGLKYKKCCLGKDEAANVTRIATSEPLTIQEKINTQFEWPHGLHRMIALHFVKETQELYEADEIQATIELWNRFAIETVPVVKKLGVYPAALEYVLCQIFEYETTQSVIAAKYSVSVATLSQRANRIFDFLNEIEPEPPTLNSANSPMNAERELARLHSLLDQQNFNSIEEANEFLQRNMNRKPAPTKKTSQDQAAELLFEAWDEPNPRRRTQLAQEALRLDANNVDAYNLLAECAQSPKEMAFFYKQGLLVAEKHFGEAFFEENKGHFWGYLPTRPYMRAKKGYAETCAMMDKMPEAIQHYRELLELNPNDNQGVRELLVSAYIETLDWKAAEALILRFDMDESAAFNYSRVLVEYGLNGKSAKLTARIKKAISRNPHVPAYLQGTIPLPRQMPDYVGFGDDREAIVYAMLNRHLWQVRPELLQLLSAGKK